MSESTWARLTRRKVVQWGIACAAGAWGFVQGLEYLSDTFHWPEQLRQIALLAIPVGLPIVLVLAWYHGDRGHQQITTPEFAILTHLQFLVQGQERGPAHHRGQDFGDSVSPYFRDLGAVLHDRDAMLAILHRAAADPAYRGNYPVWFLADALGEADLAAAWLREDMKRRKGFNRDPSRRRIGAA